MLALAAGLAALAAPAGADTRRVQKRAGGPIRHVFWADHASDGKAGGLVDITALPPTLAEGDQFDLVDAKGYWGRVTVMKIETLPLGCKGQYRRGRAKPERPPERSLSLPVVALGPAPQTPPRAARLLSDDTALDAGAPRKEHALERRLVDLDGDGTPELLRHYFYCDPSAGASDYCMESWVRVGTRWKILDTFRIDLCQ
jgi:hypothetical protein